MPRPPVLSAVTALALLLVSVSATPPQIPLLSNVDSSAPVAAPTREYSGRFLHITDMHLDPYYQEGATITSACHWLPEAEKGERPVFGPRRKQGKEGIAGRYGAAGSGCDSPLALVNETMRFVHDVLRPKGIDFVVWTGDSARHDSDAAIARTPSDIKSINALAVEYLVQTFLQPSDSAGEAKTVPIIPNIGNNDIWPHNDLAFTSGRTNPTLHFYSVLWARFIPKEQIPEFLEHGNFVVEPTPGVLVASINTMYLSDANRMVGDCEPKGFEGNAPVRAGDVVLHWLQTKVLERARKEGKVAYLIGHVPPNPLNYFDNCYESFAHLMIEYSEEVVGQFYGHMNIDHFFFSSSIIPVGKNRATTVESAGYRSVLKATKPDFSLPMAPRGSFLGRVFSALIPSWINLYYHYLLTHYKHLAHQHAKDPSLRTLHPIFVAPSVVPTFNPGLRTFRYHRGNVTVTHQAGDAKSMSGAKRGSLRRGELVGYTQYYADIERWNSEGLEENAEFPGYVFETSYEPAAEYDFQRDRFDKETWVRFGARMTGVASGNREAERLKKLFAANLVVKLGGVEVKDF
ncbi:Metallo-dependent phosphatase-like protein [Powellomyces hirtus]|nr:Metallo-dependent phosphatase-like protein [Powellomyces hirtus]